jgi:cytochrome c5
MNYRTAAIAFLALALALVALATAQTSSTNSAAPQASQNITDSPTPHAQDTAVHDSHPPANLSGDDAYKQNCTRCHSEVPPLNARRTRTIVRHMRVRANITAEEAEAILQYLTQ